MLKERNGKQHTCDVLSSTFVRLYEISEFCRFCYCALKYVQIKVLNRSTFVYV
jgi:hypothetical protein